MGSNKEVFDTELFSVGEAPDIALKSGRVGNEASRERSGPRCTRIHIWADSQVVIKRLQNTAPSPGQWLASRIIRITHQLVEQRTAVEIHWVPGHMSFEGNEKTDKMFKEVEESTGTRRCLERLASLAYVRRPISGRKWKESRHWLTTENDRHPPLQRPRYVPALES